MWNMVDVEDAPKFKTMKVVDVELGDVKELYYFLVMLVKQAYFYSDCNLTCAGINPLDKETDVFTRKANGITFYQVYVACILEDRLKVRQGFEIGRTVGNEAGFSPQWHYIGPTPGPISYIKKTAKDRTIHEQDRSSNYTPEKTKTLIPILFIPISFSFR